MSIEASKTGRLIELDACRGLAAVAVVLFHFTTRYDQLYGHPSAPWFYLPFGYLGVHIFFMISGFVIDMTLERTSRARDFVIARFARLYPVYWASLLVTTIVVLVVGLPNREVTWTHWVANLTMLNGFVGIPYVDGVYWSLRVELSFYIFICGVFFFVGKRAVIPAMACWLAAEAAYLFVPGATENRWISKAASLAALPYADLFVAGTIYLRIYIGQAKRLHLIILLAAVCLRLYVSNRPEFFGILIANMTFLLIIYGKAPFLRFKPFVWLGSISYPLYLIHQNAGYAIMRDLYALGLPTWLGLTVAIVFAIAISWALHHIFELPGNRLIRGGYHAWRQASHGQSRFAQVRVAIKNLCAAEWKAKQIRISGAILLIAIGCGGYFVLSETQEACEAEYQIAIIGDSISIQYADRLAYLLDDEACVYHTGINAKDARHALQHFDRLISNPQNDIIILNVGLWDALERNPCEHNEYESSIRSLMRKAKTSASHVIWLETTPVLESLQSRRSNSDIALLNAVAKRVTEEETVTWLPIGDLFKSEPTQMIRKDGVHLSGPGAQSLAKYIAKAILNSWQTIHQ